MNYAIKIAIIILAMECVFGLIPQTIKFKHQNQQIEEQLHDGN